MGGYIFAGAPFGAGQLIAVVGAPLSGLSWRATLLYSARGVASMTAGK